MLSKTKPSPEVIAQLKETFPSVFLYRTRDDKEFAIFTPMSNDLYTRVKALAHEEQLKGNHLPVEEVSNKVFDECVVWPKITEDDKVNLAPGTIPDVIKCIQEKSGFLDIDLFERPLRRDTFTQIIKDFVYWDEPTQEEIDGLKERIPFRLFKIYLDNWIFIVRTMTRGDIEQALKALDDQLTVCQICTMWPAVVDWDSIPAGSVESLFQEIKKVSYMQTESVVEEL